MGSSSTNQTLAGKVAIVTGASRGLGRGFALELARRGANVVATYTSSSSSSKVQDLQDEISQLESGAKCISVKADLLDRDSAAVIVTRATAAFGDQIDILVNNAGGEVVKPFQDIKPEDFDSVYHLNVLAPMLLLQATYPHLPKQGGGRIINIASVGARHGFRHLSLYCSSKAALEGMTRCWAQELGDEGHTVNTVNPGPVQSEMLENIPKDIVEMQKKTTPVQRRLGTVDDVAQIVAWLASEESRWVTGQSVSASGGWAMY